MAREIKITETADDPMKVFKEVISIGFGVAFGVGGGMGRQLKSVGGEGA